MIRIIMLTFIAVVLLAGAASWGMGREAAYYRAEARV